MAKQDSWSNQGRFDTMGCVASVVLALMLSVTSFTVMAQTDFEFEDPLAETRAKIERGDLTLQPSPQSPPAAPTETGERTASASSTVDAKGPVTVFAERLGLPTAGLVGLGILALLALVLGFMWLIGRRKSAHMSQRTDRELYAVADGARGRRSLESGAQVTRNRKKFLDTTEEEEITARPSAASKAAQIISGTAATDHADHIDQDDDAYKMAFEAELQGDTETTEVAVQPDDPSTWRRPNLDRLKDSIRKDWTKNDEEPDNPEADEIRDEAKVFADLFGDDVPPTPPATDAAPVAPKSQALDMLDTFEEDEQPMSVSALRSAVEKSAGGVQASAKSASDSMPDRAEALRRIKALRESVKAS